MTLRNALSIFIHGLVPPRVKWGHVTRVFAVKEDIFGYEAVSLLIDFDNRKGSLSVQPETLGYKRILRQVHENLPNVDPKWYENMMKYPMPCIEWTLYERGSSGNTLTDPE